jgi:DNA-binding response OmpR family regulator
MVDVITDNAAAASALRGSAVSQRILLVDDEPSILLTMKAILEMSGFDVVTAASSAEAKLRLEADSYHLVITDMKMENETSGFEVVRFAREQQYRPAIAILTAYPDLGNDWQEQGADSLWIKPANMPELLEGIKALLARQQITTWREEKTSILAKGVQLPSGATTT